nr:MAG: DNA pilot protein [Microvirus Sku28]
MDAMQQFAGQLATTAFGAAASFGNSRRSIKAQKAENKLNRDFQREMWNKNRDYSLKMWQKNNEYNDPKNQVERLKGAGMNPALAMQKGNLGTAATAPTAPSVSGGAGGITPPSVDAGINAITDFGFNLAQRIAQVKNTNASSALLGSQTDLNKGLSPFVGKKALSEIDLNDSQKTLNSKVSKLKEIESLYSPESYRLNNDLVGQQIGLIQEETRLIEQQALQQSLQNTYLPDILKSQIAESQSRTALNFANGQLSQQEFKKKIYETTDMMYQSSISQARARFEGKVLDEQLSNLKKWRETADKQIENLTQQAELMKKNNDMYMYNVIMNSIKDISVSLGTLMVGSAAVKNSGKTPINHGGAVYNIPPHGSFGTSSW